MTNGGTVRLGFVLRYAEINAVGYKPLPYRVLRQIASTGLKIKSLDTSQGENPNDVSGIVYKREGQGKIVKRGKQTRL